MSKSLAQLRESSRTALPERTIEMCLSQGLVAEVQALEFEKRDLAIEISRPDDEGDKKPRRKAGEQADPRLTEIDERLEVLYDEMREHTGRLVLAGVTSGEWRLWADAHPAREDNNFDDAVTFGFCNAADLMEALGSYAKSWNGTLLDKGDWDFIESKAAPGDLKNAAQNVVQMHEAVGAVAPKSRKGSSPAQTSEPSSASPAPSESPASDS